MSTTTFAPPPGDSTIVGSDNPPPDAPPAVVLPLLPDVPARAVKPTCHFPHACKWPTCAC